MSSHNSTVVDNVRNGVEMMSRDGSTTQSLNQPNGHLSGSTTQTIDPSVNEPTEKGELKRDQSSKQVIESMRGNANMLQYYKLQSSLWKDVPSLSITYRDLTYQHLVAPDDGSIPSLYRSFVSFFLLKKWTIKPTVFTALQPNTGLVKPGTMTLILAPPGHGKSTLLKALAARLVDDKRMSGTIKYNGLTAAETRAQHINLQRMTAFVDQGEAHNALMTVRETFQFALDNAVADPVLLQSPEFTKASAEKVEYMIASAHKRCIEHPDRDN